MHVAHVDTGQTNVDTDGINRCKHSHRLCCYAVCQSL